MQFLGDPPRNLFFTGKGGVGKTSIASATAIALADRGRRVLLVSTDPASNLDEVLGTRLSAAPTAIVDVPGLAGLNIDPVAAAAAYRERMVGPYRGILPDVAIRSIEEQLSGACTVEIAAFDEFSKLLGEPEATAAYDHVVFDTAPTGHTLRLLELPAAWTAFLEASASGTSCLGPLAGMQAQRSLYQATLRALADRHATMTVLVARPEGSALAEAARASAELVSIGITRQSLVINGLFEASDARDPVALAWQERGRRALHAMPPRLAELPRAELPLLPRAPIGIAGLRALLAPERSTPVSTDGAPDVPLPHDAAPLAALIDQLAESSHGTVMTMGKGGVGKTTIARRIAAELAERGHRVHLTTTDPAAHDQGPAGQHPNLRVSRIDPGAETRAYVAEAMAAAGADLDAAGRALLEEDLRSPCTEEVAVFRAFARVVDDATREIVVIDTAPTGHTLLLLDAAEAYHREVSRSTGQVPEAVRRLLPRLRDPALTRILVVTLPEATPVHEAAQLQADLERAGIAPFGWVINQSLIPIAVTDPLLRQRRASEAAFHAEVATLARRVAVVPWSAQETDPT